MINSTMMRRSLRRWFALFLLPMVAAFCIGFVWPFIQGIYLSFCNFNVPSDAKWIGINNYVRTFNDAGFFRAFKNTAALFQKGEEFFLAYGFIPHSV